jgi:hypothetical protein
MSDKDRKPNQQQKSWNFLATLFYIVCFVGLGYGLKARGLGAEDFRFRDIALMTLATYRLTRLLVFDAIFKLFRDFVRKRSHYLVFYVIREIITCPWCAGIWACIIIVAIYFLVPFGQILILLFAIAGVASFIVIIVNLAGLSTEEKQHRVRELKEESDYSSPHHEP